MYFVYFQEWVVLLTVIRKPKLIMLFLMYLKYLESYTCEKIILDVVYFADDFGYCFLIRPRLTAVSNFTNRLVFGS